jgi:hypothetical protein
MTRMNETWMVVFEGGPRDGQVDMVDRQAVVIGRGDDGGVYQRTEETREGHTVYRWQMLTDAEASALDRADVRANEWPDR